MKVAARHAFVNGAFEGPTTIETSGTTLIAVRAWQAGDPEPLAGTLLPGLVNAHLHLETSWALGRVAAGLGFNRWVAALLDLTVHEDAWGCAIEQTHALVDYGTAAVSDICNGEDTGPLFAEAGIGGVVQRELFSMDKRRLPLLLERAAEAPQHHDGADIVTRASPHGTYSTPPELMKATVKADGHGRPASIHVSEDLNEHAFLLAGEGAWPKTLDAMGLEWRPWTPPGRTPVGWLDALGLLGPELMLVHGVHLTREDLEILKHSGSPLVLCPRSNLHIGGLLPDVPSLLNHGIPLALGTDSLASAPDLDVLGEVAALVKAWPGVPLADWIHLATEGGANALRLPWAGVLEAGRAPGVLHIDQPPDTLLTGERRWLVRAGVR